MSLSAYEAICEAADEVYFGTIILPLDMLAAYNFNMDETIYWEMPLEVYYDKDFYAVDGDTAMFSGAIININEGNINREFIAVSFMVINGTYIFGDYSVDGARSAFEVAQKAYNDAEGGYTAEQLNALATFYGAYAE